MWEKIWSFENEHPLKYYCKCDNCSLILYRDEEAKSLPKMCCYFRFALTNNCTNIEMKKMGNLSLLYSQLFLFFFLSVYFFPPHPLVFLVIVGSGCIEHRVIIYTEFPYARSPKSEVMKASAFYFKDVLSTIVHL